MRRRWRCPSDGGTTTVASSGSIDCAAIQSAKADLVALHALDGVDTGLPASMGTVKDSIDTYQQANDLAKKALAGSGASSSEGQQLVTMTSDMTKFLSNQAPSVPRSKTPGARRAR
jgi:hypothetical protein